MRWYIDDEGFPKCSDSIQQSVDRTQTQIEAPTGLSNFHTKKITTIPNLYHKKQANSRKKTQPYPLLYALVGKLMILVQIG
ncbi:hypothetical protein LINGRAHAP2_LOCUS20309 [Linum grandiflorum]